MSKQLFTTAEAIAFIKKAPRGSDFAVYVRGDAPIADDDHVFPSGLNGYLKISRSAAIKLVGNF